MASNDQAFDWGQRQRKGGVAEQGEEALVEEQHGIEGIHHADGVLADGVDQGMIGSIPAGKYSILVRNSRNSEVNYTLTVEGTKNSTP